MNSAQIEAEIGRLEVQVIKWINKNKKLEQMKSYIPELKTQLTTAKTRIENSRDNILGAYLSTEAQAEKYKLESMISEIANINSQLNSINIQANRNIATNKHRIVKLNEEISSLKMQLSGGSLV